jgi:hypothetical protein
VSLKRQLLFLSDNPLLVLDLFGTLDLLALKGGLTKHGLLLDAPVVLLGGRDLVWIPLAAARELYWSKF